MNVLHFGTLDVKSGGPAMSVYLTLKGIRCLGIDAEIIQFQIADESNLIGRDIPVHNARRPFEKMFGYSPRLHSEILSLGDFDIYHAQGVWQYNTYAIVDIARRLGKPYVITPRGMLYPQDIAKSNSWLKKLSLRWRLIADLNGAACVQVTCDDEMKYCRELGVTAPIAVIPNPVEIKDYTYRKKDGIFRLGYLGRLSKRKNVESLIYAFAEIGADAKDAELFIIGAGDVRYENFLKSEVRRLGLSNVRFSGFLSGEEKSEALASCSVIAMPSEFENLGNVVLEGLVRRTPCIATKGSPWQVLQTHGCGWWVEYSQTQITSAVKEALNTPQEVLEEMGRRGRALVESRYSVQNVASNMKLLYDWILGNVAKPGFVYG